MLQGLRSSALPGEVDAPLLHSLYMHLYSDTKDWVDAFFAEDGLTVLNQLLMGAIGSAAYV